MQEAKLKFLPTVKNNLEPNTNNSYEKNTGVDEEPILADALCPCCGNITIPNNGDALAYICPVCFWEIDLFIKSENEPSDQNHGLTLNEGRKNYIEYGAMLPRLKKHCRGPKDSELPKQ